VIRCDGHSKVNYTNVIGQWYCPVFYCLVVVSNTGNWQEEVKLPDGRVISNDRFCGGSGHHHGVHMQAFQQTGDVSNGRLLAAQ
jgi:hypothetical protein